MTAPSGGARGLWMLPAVRTARWVRILGSTGEAAAARHPVTVFRVNVTMVFSPAEAKLR